MILLHYTEVLIDVLFSFSLHFTCFQFSLPFPFSTETRLHYVTCYV